MKKMSSKAEEKFVDCIDDLKQPITDLVLKYDIYTVQAALVEMGLRMALLGSGTNHALQMFAACVHNMTTIGAMIEKDILAMKDENKQPDEIEDWDYNANITGKTIH